MKTEIGSKFNPSPVTTIKRKGGYKNLYDQPIAGCESTPIMYKWKWFAKLVGFFSVNYVSTFKVPDYEK